MDHPFRYGACAWCGDWPRDEDRSCGDRNYCRKCEAERKAVYRARRRRARLSQWFQQVRTADAERAAILVSAIVDELGGYDRAARKIVKHLHELSASGKAPAQAMRAYMAIMRMIQLGAPAEE